MKKRVWSMLLAAAMCLTMLPVTAAAVQTGTCGDGVTWSYDEDTKILTISGTGKMQDYGKWGAPWYNEDYRGDITRVIIGEGVTRIGNYAFYDCNGIKNIEIQGTITSIGDSAFHFCGIRSLENIEDVISIGKQAFYGSALESFTVPSGVTEIADGTFDSCAGLTCVTIPDSVTQIGSNAFGGNYWANGLETIIFEGDAPTIASDCFDPKINSLNIYYPKDGNWTQENMENYGAGNLTWVVDSRMVRFEGNADGDAVTNVPDPQKLEAGTATATEPTSSPERSGYTFLGWYTDQACTEETKFNFATPVQEDLTLYAKWGSEYTVTFHYNGDTADTTWAVTEGQTVAKPDDPTRDGYTFGGWYTDSACTDEQEYTFTAPVMSNLTLYAKWVPIGHTVTFYRNDGTGGIVQTETVTNSQTVAEPTAPERTGYTFVGWYTSKDADGQEYNFDQPVTDDLDLYAKWTVNTYAVTLDAKGGTIAENEKVDSYTYGTSVTLPTKVTREGYTFAGWYDSAGKKVEAISATDVGNKAFYAKWTANTYQVALEPEGGMINENERVVIYTYGVGVTLPKNVTKEGYTFAGWYATSDYTGNPVTAISETDVGNKTFYAKWTVNTYKVTLNTEGGTIAAGQDITGYTYGVGATLPTGVTKTGHTFGGWYDSADQKVETISGTETGDKTFYAKWTVDTYTVRLNPNRGTIAEGKDITSYTYGVGAALPTEVTQIGHTFGGWYDNSDCTGNPVTAISPTDTGNKEYYAKWTPVEYTVTFLDNGNASYLTVQVPYGGGLAQPADPTKEGYTFLGWYYSPDGEEYAFGHFPVTEDFSLYAKWGPYYFDAATGTLTISEDMRYLADRDDQPWKEYRDKITRVVVKEGVTKVIGNMFDGCGNLREVSLPESVTEIGASAFRDCDSLKTIDLPDNLEYIGGAAFLDCKGLTEIVFPESVTEIDDNAFVNCDALTRVVLPPKMEQINQGTFEGCDSLKTVDIPHSVRLIGKHAFRESGLERVVFQEGGLGRAALPEDGMEDGLGNGLEMEEGVFQDCKYLTDVTLSKNVTKIADNMFDGCTSLKAIDLPESVQEINEYAFRGSGLVSVTIPASVKEIEDSAFSSCKDLDAIVFEGDAPKFYEKEPEGAYEGDPGKHFLDVKATVYYPVGNASWEHKKKDYGGDLTWAENRLTITFDTGGGSAVDSQTVSYGGKATKPASNPVRAGYTFGGWYKDERCTQAFDFGTEKITGNTTIYAKWTREGGSGSGSGSAPSYPPAVPQPDNGQVTVSPAAPKRGDTVVITPEPDAGYETGQVTVTDSQGKPVAVTDRGDGTYAFLQPGGKATITVTYRKTGCRKDATCPISQFADASPTAWYHDGVHYVLETGLMVGRDDQFAPNESLTRAELAQILYNKAGRPAVTGLSTFTDVPPSAWYAEAVAWAQQNKVVDGVGGNRFAPERGITREEIAVMLYNDAGRPAVSGALTGFADSASVSGWAEPALLWATQNGVVGGVLRSDGTHTLNPGDDATRAEAATMLARYLGKG